MSEKFRKCPNCGRELPLNAQFCKSCGTRLVTNSSSLTKETEWRKVKKRVTQHIESIQPIKPKKMVERVCPKCKTIVKSKVLEQCPVCYANLSPLPESYKEQLDKMFFTGKKIVPEKTLTRDKNKWNLKESISVALNSIMIYIILESIFIGYFYIINPDLLEQNATLPINDFTILISSCIPMILGIFPLIYIYKNKHNYKKLGFWKEKLAKFIIIGIFTGVGFYFIEYWTEVLISNLINKPNVILEEQVIIRNMNIFLIIIFFLISFAQQVFEEILFRGVLQNAIREYLKNKNNHLEKSSNKTKWKTISITSVIQITFYFIFTLNIYFLVINLVSSLVVGIVYEYSKKSMVMIIFLKVSYTIIGMVAFFLILEV